MSPSDVSNLTLIGLIGLLLCLVPSPKAAAQTVGQVCYGFDGTSWVNNTKCPGSNACCGVTATCLSNRLCENPGQELLVRGPCAVDPWDSTCSQVCLYDEISSTFPRVTTCSDGSFCCNNDASCCKNGAGVFLDVNGNSASAPATVTTSYPPVSGTGTDRSTVTPTASTTSVSSSSSAVTTSSVIPTSSTPSTSSPASTSSSAAPAATTSSSPSSSSDDSTKLSLGLGLGLGIPLAAIVAGAAVWYYLRRKRSKCSQIPDNGAGYGASPGGSYALAQKPRLEQDPSELHSSGFHDTPLHELPPQNTDRERHELQ